MKRLEDWETKEGFASARLHHLKSEDGKVLWLCKGATQNELEQGPKYGCLRGGGVEAPELADKEKFHEEKLDRTERAKTRSKKPQKSIKRGGGN